MCLLFISSLTAGSLQNALAKATVNELASLYGTKYTYGPGASTICESALQNRAKKAQVPAQVWKD